MKQILIFSGAGLSAESGLDTFRDANGLWMENDPMVVANINKFEDNRELVRKFYNTLRKRLKDVEPNDTHKGIAKLQQEYGHNVVKIFTQNVDNLLEKAGCSQVNHVHGYLPWMMCREQECGHSWYVGYGEVKADDVCPQCSSHDIKPGVVFFGEHAPGYENLYSTFNKSHDDLIIVIGTSGEVVPLNMICVNRDSISGSKTILNNLEYDRNGYVDYSLFDLTLFGKTTEMWPQISAIADEFLVNDNDLPLWNNALALHTKSNHAS